MTSRAELVQTVIQAYLDLPDTPDEASHRDFAIAAELIDRGFEVDHILRAIKIGFVRRWARDHSQGPLAPIRSLAYFRAVLQGLSEQDLAPDYAFYIDFKYDQIRPDPQAWVDRQAQMISTSRSSLAENRLK